MNPFQLAMSWQLNHLLGSQPAASNLGGGTVDALSMISTQTQGVAPAPTTIATASASPAPPEAHPTIGDDRGSSLKSSELIDSSSKMQPSAGDQAAQLYQIGRGAQSIVDLHQNQNQQQQGHQGQPADGREFFQNFLGFETGLNRYKPTSASYNSLSLHSGPLASGSIDDSPLPATSDTEFYRFNQNNALGVANSNNLALGSSTSLTLEHLLPEQQAQSLHLPWSTTYSLPVYSLQSAPSQSNNQPLGPSYPGSVLHASGASNSAQPGDDLGAKMQSPFIDCRDSDNLFNSATMQHRSGSRQPEMGDAAVINGSAAGGGPIGSGRSYSSVLNKDEQVKQEVLGQASSHLLATNSNGGNSNSSGGGSSSASTPRSSGANLYQQQRQVNLFAQQASEQQQQQYPFNQPPNQFHHNHQSQHSIMNKAHEKPLLAAASSSSGGGYNLMTSGSSDQPRHQQQQQPVKRVCGTQRNKLGPFFKSSPSNQAGGLLVGEAAGLKVDMYGNSLLNSDGSERFSRKVFVGGLPPDIDEEEIKASFRRFGSLVVDWPHKAESKSYFPPKGYAFLLFHEESSVQALIDNCFQEEDKLYLCVSSPTIKDKPVQIRPWRLSDADFVLDSTLALNPRKTVFVGGVPRPLKANELANIMNDLYSGVCYAGIDTDPELKYPKGAGRVAFSNNQSYLAAISARFVHLHHSEIEKRVEIKPYVLDDQFCDECQGSKCQNKFAPFFCANIQCLKYYCELCWQSVHHSQSGKEFHKPLVKEGADRPRGLPFRW